MELDIGASGSRLCRIADAEAAVTGAGGTIDEAVADALRLWAAAERQGS